MKRECCNHCLWYGPVNQDGTMRKHRPATLDDKWGRPNKVQDMSAEPCPGSHKAYAHFGAEVEPCGKRLLRLSGSFTTCAKPKGHDKACTSA